jgi:uncharacterized damage-inducible protein DinB
MSESGVSSGHPVTRNIRMLLRYSAWANARIFAVLGGLPDGEAVAPRSTAFGNMVNTLNHAYVVDLIWQAHLEGRPHGFTSRITAVEPALRDLQAAQAEIDRWYIGYADGLSGGVHDEVVQFRFVDGGAGAMTRGEMLLHVVNHKTYHRGVVADLLYQAGSRPPVMDLPVFLRDASPAAIVGGSGNVPETRRSPRSPVQDG